MDFKKASLKKPEDFFKAIDILFEEKSGNWLDTSPRWGKVVDNKKTSDREQTDPTIHSDLRNLTQGSNEPLQKYYQRSLDILSRSRCRDEPLAESGDECLNPLEVVFLSRVIASFIQGVCDSEVRSNILFKSHNTYRSLHESMTKFREIETRIAEKNELEQFREMYSQGRPISAAVARLNQQNYVEPERNYSPRNKLPPSFLYQTTMNTSERSPSRNQNNRRPENRGSNFYQNQNSKPNGSKNYKGIDSKLLPPKIYSKNPYVNGSQSWSRSLGPLCMRCGTIGHASQKCESYGSAFLEFGNKLTSRKLFFQ
ncbi:hypothetical protein HI914_01294 [Erysiphe necator]|nr:hypothetical protein HI914_01294 [Erysiphe necator]